MTFVDFSDYGIEDSMPYDPEELAVVNLECQMLMRRNTESVCRSVLDQWELALQWQAQTTDRPANEWFNRALLCIAMRGHLGDRRPKFFDLSDLR
jgi:hypothetical protein